MRKIWSKLTKILSKMCIKTAELRLIFTKIKTSITPYKKQKLKKSFYFHILRWTGFLMMPLTTLYDYYVDRQKMSEQKKNLRLELGINQCGRKIVVAEYIRSHNRR